MLSGNLCEVRELTLEGGQVNALLCWKADHAIFAGHFPGQPVVPGVCMLQLVEEVLEQATGRQLQLKECANIKFLHVIDPRMHAEVSVSIAYRVADSGDWSVNASLQQESLVFFKMSGAYAVTGA